VGGGPRDYTSRNPYLAALQRVFLSVVGAGVSPAQVGGRFPFSVSPGGWEGVPPDTIPLYCRHGISG